MSRRLLSVLLVVCCCGGCVLDAVPMYGEKCPPEGGEGAVFGNVMEGSGFCAGYNACIPIGTTPDYLCTTQCGSDTDERAPGTAYCAGKCLESFGDLHIARCEMDDDVPQCEKGFADCDRKLANGCEADLNSAMTCGGCDLECVPAGVENSLKVACESARCVAKQCAVDHHLSELGGCIPDTDEACTLRDTGEIVNCRSENHASDGVCDSGRCRILSCIAGYHVSETENGSNCVENTNESCGASASDCTQIEHAVSAYCNLSGGFCAIGECDPGYHIRDNSCHEDTINECGMSLAVCTPPDNAVPSCTDGGCRYTCRMGYHDTGDACEKDSLESCGASGKTCSQQDIPNSTAVSCATGTCVASKCAPGFHVYNGACEQNSLQNCGGHAMRCPNPLCATMIDTGNKENYTNNDVFCISDKLVIAPGTKSVSMPNLIYAGGLDMEYTSGTPGQIASLSLNQLQELGKKAIHYTGNDSANKWDCSIKLIYAEKLKQFSLPSLQMTEGELYFNELKSLTSISLPKLPTVNNSVITSIPNLESLSFPAAKTVLVVYAGYLGSEENAKSIQRIDFPAITSGSYFSFYNNPRLVSVNLHNIQLKTLIAHDNKRLPCSGLCSAKNAANIEVKDAQGNACNFSSVCK